MEDDHPAMPAPGWYREHAAAAGLRWWDGRGWTEHRTSSAGPAAVHQPPLPPHTRVNTVWIWLLSLIPLFALAGEQPVLLAFGPLVREQVVLQRQLLTSPGSAILPAAYGDVPAMLAISWGTSVLLIGCSGLLAWLDSRALRRRGIVRPFPWGWGFATGVYLVGRTVVVRRRVGRGLPPLVLGVVLFVVAMVVQLGEFLAVFASLSAAPLN